ncbi:hypothetical protein BRDID11004_16140 [Bradyrhizobium diazoefficiens]|uniref:Uncharacterized protein n=1 Tax=Bradyrhizobium diazoefficiens TaxID=1355477 RepID=A0A810AEG8_9BRAD|nr:hypothetical protein [Bradyrhizobium diazoefficiens]BBZ97475.1 hypothetical protein F07S3_73080 [Bradyrhizobium diazoefficiens]BCA15159.1 hypothetical protein BDHF08_70060 [Bradyrhizobium diazoefficiens]BCE59571.1 hypothetical protein XF5B_70830 [Bradyrhizobium diazoefficiens]BCE68254.1 hypothetical protein XF6B_70530 [Bradyrhizobium diazoefficiens]
MNADDYRKSADALGSILDGATRRSGFENICSEAVHYELQAQFGNDYTKGSIPSGLYGFLLQKMAKAASDYALPKDIDQREFEETLLNDALGIVRSLRYAFVRYGSEKSSPNFWDNNASPLEKIRTKQVPYIDRSELESVVGDYLALPYRSQALDRFLVRVLIAMELYAFGDEMLNEETFGLFPARSPLRQRHALLGYLRGQLVNGVLFGGIAALALWAGSSRLIGLSTAEWITGVCGFLFLALASVSTFALPFWWYAQAMARRRVRKLLSGMSTLYNEQKSDGPISAQYVRDRAEDATKQGVVWPAPLFALLDDIISRTGRF